MDLPDLTEKRIDGETIHDAGFIKLVRDKVVQHDGKHAERYVLRHPGAVGVACQFEDKSVLLVRQYRYSIGAHSIEVPCGKIDPNEDILTCGKRELLEETGYEADNWDFLYRSHSSTGFTDEMLIVFHATGLHQVNKQQTDEGEHIQLLRLKLEDAYKLADEGKITENRTLYALLWMRWQAERKTKELVF